MKKVLNRDCIKYIAVFAMLLDHIAWTFLQFSSPVSQIFHIIGRTTAPIMCFFIAEGYCYTRDKKKYALRLFVFALISQFPWWLMHGEFFTLSFNMIFTLFLGLIAVHVEATLENKAGKILLILLLCFASSVCDWSTYAILWCVGFYKYRESNCKKFIWFSAVGILYFALTFFQSQFGGAVGAYGAFLSSFFTLGVFLSIPLILLYNGEKGKFAASKWAFYIFYPLHILIIGLISYFIG